MPVPVTVIASTRPDDQLLRQVDQPGVVVIADRDTAWRIGAAELVAGGRVVMSEPEVFYRSPGCPCCSVREDLVAAVVRAMRRAVVPERLVIVVDPEADDLLTAISTILSTIEIQRRCSLDAVVAHIDAVECSTRLATGIALAEGGVSTALAVADRVVIDGAEHVTTASLDQIHTAVHERAGFAQIDTDDAPVVGVGERLDAWHGAPAARDTAPESADAAATITLTVDEPLDPDLIDEWLDTVVARHASRLLRLQGALSVVGHDERICCYGVRSFATSHSEREHEGRRSNRSVVAICGVGLDADELAESFRATVAS